MKPCPKNEKLIAWLALDELDKNAAGELRTHLNSCAGCRDYWEQVSAVSQEHSARANVPVAATANHAFHQRLKTRIREELRISVAARIESFLRHWLFERYPVARVAAAATVLVLVIAIVFASRLGVRLDAPDTVVIVTDGTPVQPEDLPTLSAYRMAANDSLEAFDNLLAKEAARQTGHAETLRMFAFRKVDPEN